MKLIKIIERPLASFGKPGLDNELHIREPSQFELEQAKTRVHFDDDADTIVIYKD